MRSASHGSHDIKTTRRTDVSAFHRQIYSSTYTMSSEEQKASESFVTKATRIAGVVATYWYINCYLLTYIVNLLTGILLLTYLYC